LAVSDRELPALRQAGFAGWITKSRDGAGFGAESESSTEFAWGLGATSCSRRTWRARRIRELQCFEDVATTSRSGRLVFSTTSAKCLNANGPSGPFLWPPAADNAGVVHLPVAACVLIWGTTWYAIKFQAGRFGAGCRLRSGSLCRSVAPHGARHGTSARSRLGTQAWLAALGCSVFASFSFTLRRCHRVGLVAVGYSALPLVNMCSRASSWNADVARCRGRGRVRTGRLALIFWPEFERLSTARR
jgi:hypothetical protein